MTIRWLQATYLWLQTIPALILLIWAAAEKLRRRRLRAFGDPAILGISPGWTRPVAGILLLVLAFACVAALLALPVETWETAGPKRSILEILLDSRISEQDGREAGYTLAEVEDQVHALVGMAPPAYVALFRLGDPPEIVCPATADGDALTILMSRLRLDRKPDTSVALGESIKIVRKSVIAGETPLRCLIVLTARPVDDVTVPRAAEEFSDVLFVQMAEKGSEILPSPGGRWIRKSQPDQFRSFMTRECYQQTDSPARFRAWSPVQSLAALAFIALLAESMFTLFVRPSDE